MRPDDHDFDEEIRGHLALSVRERIERGEDPEAARRAAVRELGYVPAIRDSLRRLNFFNSFSDEEIDEIIKAGSMQTYQAGQAIIEEDTLDNALYLLALGAAEVRKKGKPISTFSKGDAFGEVGFLTKAKRTASVVATSSALALKINATLMDQLSQECQLKFYKVFTELLIYRLNITSAKLSAKS